MLENANWYLMRSTGLVALLLLTLVMALGLLTSGRGRIARQPRFVTVALHRNASLLAVVFLAIHVITALVDPYAALSLLAVLVPGARAGNPLWISLGAVSLDLMAALIVTSLVRVRLGHRTWRATHWFAYAAWPLAFAHSLGAGTDSSALWFRAVAFTCLAVLLTGGASRLRPRQTRKRIEPGSAVWASRTVPRAAWQLPETDR